MRKKLITVIALVLIVCAAVALAQTPAPPTSPVPPAGPPAGPGVGPGLFPGGRMNFGMTCPAMAAAPPTIRMIERVDVQLAEDQKTKLTAALTKGEEALAPLRRESAKASQALRNGVMTAGIETEKLAQLAQAAQKAEADIVTAELLVWTEIRSILSADQSKKLQELTAGRMGNPRFSVPPAQNPPTAPVK